MWYFFFKNRSIIQTTRSEWKITNKWYIAAFEKRSKLTSIFSDHYTGCTISSGTLHFVVVSQLMDGAKICLTQMKDTFQSFKMTPTCFGTMSNISFRWHLSQQKALKSPFIIFYENWDVVKNLMFKYQLFRLKISHYDKICLLSSFF